MIKNKIMGKNYKEQATYSYLHDTGRSISRKLLYRLKRKWWRHNCDIGEMRVKRRNKDEEERTTI